MKLLDTTLSRGLEALAAPVPLTNQREILRRLIEIGLEELEVGTKTLAQEAAKCPSLKVFLRLPEGRVPKESLWEGPFGLSLNLSQFLKEERYTFSHKLPGPVILDLHLPDSRLPQDFLQICKEIFQKKSFRLRVIDTSGVLHPREVVVLLERLRKILPGVELGFRAENHFGLATANTITALLSGANFVDVSVLGLGPGAGTARLEEVMAWLFLRLGMRRYRVSVLGEVSRFVAWQTGEVLSEGRPVVGRRVLPEIFTLLSDI